MLLPGLLRRPFGGRIAGKLSGGKKCGSVFRNRDAL